MSVSLSFFHNIGPNSTLCPKSHTCFPCFADFHYNMLGNSININNLCCNPVVLKKIDKTSLKLVLCPNCIKRDHYEPCPK